MKADAMMAAAIFAAAAAFAAETVTYDASDPQTSYANGALSVSYDNGAITSITADPETAGDIDVSGDAMALSSTESAITLSSTGTVTFANSLAAVGASAESPVDIGLSSTMSASSTVTLPAKLVFGEQLVALGMKLATITNLVARFDHDPGQSGSGFPADGVQAFFVDRDGQTLTCQFQKRTSTAVLRVVRVALTQRADGVYAKNTHYGHLDLKNEYVNVKEGDVDILETNSTLSEFSASDPYRAACFVTNLTVFCDTVAVQPALVKLNGQNALTNAAITIGHGAPMNVEIGHVDAFPNSGSVEVAENGQLTFAIGNTGNILKGVDNKVPITVRKGGVLASTRAYSFNATGARFILDGGLFIVSPMAAHSSNDSSIYVHDVTFRNGARITGARMRVRSNTTTWKVEGTTPSLCESGIYVWSESQKSRSKFSIDVDDVTGDDDPDFLLTGPVYMPSDFSNYGYASIIKKGAGTMKVGAVFAMTNTPTRIEGGAFLVDGDWLHPQCSFVLAGGTFAVSAGSTNTCGTLAVESASAISVADGASLSFAASGSESWSGALTLRCNLEACSIRFGTGSDGLTRGQCAKISLSDGRHVRLDENGYVVGSSPLVLIVR